MIRNPLSLRALSRASKTLNFSVKRPTNPSRKRYRPSKKEAIAPREAPTKTAQVPRATPTHSELSKEALKTKPAPRVRMDPGTKQMVATKYTAMKLSTPATGWPSIHSKKSRMPSLTYWLVKESAITKTMSVKRRRPTAIFLMRALRCSCVSSSSWLLSSLSLSLLLSLLASIFPSPDSASIGFSWSDSLVRIAMVFLFVLFFVVL
mmetsp:Transcript_6958/g.14149  ORF Transcript_6958/g.14149 Transcript_6958/m.14149 type:complete len:206 (+) Transcript_6958:680-1297(+)